MSEIEALQGQLRTLESVLVDRIQFARRAGLQFGGDRDVWNALGYAETPRYTDYCSVYRRQDVAGRIVDQPVRATWREVPLLVDTDDEETKSPFEEAWLELVGKKRIVERFKRVDTLASLGEFAVLLVGLRGEDDFAKPLIPGAAGEEGLLYMTPYSQGATTVDAYDDDKRSERFGWPTMYSLQTQVATGKVATIALRRNRQERTISFSGLADLIGLKPSKVFSIDFPELGLDAQTTWEVEDQTLVIESGDDTEAPAVRIDISARELDPTVFDLDASSSKLVESAIVPGLDSPFDVDPPGEPQVSESQFLTNTGAGVKSRVDLTWTAPPTGVVVGYIVSYKPSSDTDFIFLAETPDLNLSILDLAPRTYDFNVTAVNSLNNKSEPAAKLGVAIEGLGAAPNTPTGFGGSPSGALVGLRWDKTADLDVQFGGKVEIRHHSNTAGGNSENSRFIDDVDGNSTTQTVEFIKGTYYLSFVDQTGNRSGFAEWSTEDIRPVPFGQTITAGVFNANDGNDENQATIQEDPTFPSTNLNNTLIEDVVNQWLELPPKSTWDDVVNVDLVTNVDEIGADGEVAEEGVYFFSTEIELTEPQRVRLEAELTTQIVDESNSIDAISNIDDVLDIDAVGAGTAQPGQATAYIEVRVSRGTVASDTFGPWQRLEARDFFQRSFQFRIRAFSFSPTVNIRISEARILARQLPVDA